MALCLRLFFFRSKKYRHLNSKNDITDLSKILSEKYLNEKLILLLFKWRKRQITWKIKLFNLIISENTHLVKKKSLKHSAIRLSGNLLCTWGKTEKYRLLCTWENSENIACCVPGKFGEISPAVYLGKFGEISPAVYLREIEISNS